MLYRENSLKNALRAGESCRAVWLFSGSPENAEIIAQFDIDAIIIDREHSPGGLDTTIHQARAVRAAGQATLLARCRGDDPREIKLLLDIGFEGLLFPDVRSAAQAERIVAATAFEPHGTRGAHYTVSRAASWGDSGNEYALNYRDRTLIGVMIESAEGVENAAAISAVDGVDLVFIGPLDLSLTLGVPGEWVSLELASAIRQVQAAAEAHGKFFGITAAQPDVMAKWCSSAPQFVTIGSDVSMLQHAARQLITQHPRTEKESRAV